MASTKAPGTKKKPATRARGTSGVQLGEETARALILQGAARVFAERGVRAASVAHILETANVARRTFYRFYESKEDVLMALYHAGTEGLLAAWKHATSRAHAPIEQLELCTDAHLLNARGLGRLVFVLGGEAQRYESPLHARRLQVHDELVQMLCQAQPSPVDPLLVRGVVIALEGIARATLLEGDEGRSVSPTSLARARASMLRLAAAALFAEDARVPGLPALA
ncbi:MAG: hypothetical protein JWN04_2762 [Myxococcaceae bacterium]|nr:hypothetical protein [Myxococcaceae bacterium]